MNEGVLAGLGRTHRIGIGCIVIAQVAVAWVAVAYVSVTELDVDGSQLDAAMAQQTQRTTRLSSGARYDLYGQSVFSPDAKPTE